MSRFRCCLALVVLLLPLAALRAQKEFGFDNRKPSGQDYLKPEESLRRLKIADGYEVKLFAAEPDITNPIAFTIDERGRLWVVESYEYPKRTPAGQKPRDRIKILEDTDGDGKCDKVTVWAEGKDFPVAPGHKTAFDLASGIEVGHGGVFLGAAPHLWFLKDAKGTGEADTFEILLSGFGSQDTHEMLNTFQWGPDGMLTGLHGIYTQSKVGPVELNAAVWRYDVRSKQFGVWAEGTSNPWGLDYDPHGQAFLCCCVIPHAFHMIGGGYYRRQSGQGKNPYAYGELKEICDHTHHKESGWAHAGAMVLQGDHVPKELQGSLIMGSIHGCAIKRNTLERNGSTFVAHRAPDFLVSEDKNFRPINLRWGPDGSIYVIDWHDQYPCHQTPADAWDYKYGRIYKIQPKGVKSAPAPDLAKKSSPELVKLLDNDNPWWYRTALRLLRERRNGDRDVVKALKELAVHGKSEELCLRGLWGLYGYGAFDDEIAGETLKHKSSWMRAWTVRLLGESGEVSAKMLTAFESLAEKDPTSEVRLQLASTAQQLTKQDVLPLLHNLMKHKEDAKDPALPLMIWLAYEKKVPGGGRNASLEWLKDNAAGNPLVTDEIVPRTVRRLVATGKAEDLAACVAFLGEVSDSAVRRKALEGMLAGLQNRQVDPPDEWRGVLAKLTADKDAEVGKLAKKLAVNFRDEAAIKAALAAARDVKKAIAERLDAVRSLGLAHPPEARVALQEIVLGERSPELQMEACRSLSAYDNAEVPVAILKGWKTYAPIVRTEAVNLLTGRKEWARSLLDAVGKKDVPRTDLTDSVILRLRAFRDKDLDAKVVAVWGKFRDTPAELNALIEKMRGELAKGKASFERGRKVFETNCSKCHRFEGKGFTVGPELDGAARDIEYLLINVLDPNRVVGEPYFERFVNLKNGRVERGLLAAEDERSITLKTENDALKAIQKKDIDTVEVQEKSVMPEGLGNAMSVQDFRDLVRYVMAHPYLVEVEVSAELLPEEAAKLDLKTDRLPWKRPEVPVSGRIPLPATTGKGDQVRLIRTEVTTGEGMKTKLLLGTQRAVRVWVNEAEVFKGGPTSGQEQTAVDVELKPGANRVVIAVRYQGDKEAVYARFLDPNRKLRYPEEK